MEGEIGERAEVQGSKEGKVEEGQKESGGSLEESELDTGSQRGECYNGSELSEAQRRSGR